MKITDCVSTYVVLLALGTALMLGAPAAGWDDRSEDPELAETQTRVPTLPPPVAYKAKGNVVEIELSEYAGYSGIIVANGGLEPSEDSIFFKKYGFKVKLTLSEEESWPALNSGAMAGSATTVDVLAAYGRQFNVVVPAMIGFSRGADGVVVRKEVKQINDLRGKVLATSQFTEADFFIRYLAQEAGLPIKLLSAFSDSPDPEKVNLIFCKDAFAAGDLFLRDVKEGRNRLAGCITWAPKTNEIAEASDGAMRVLITSANLLIIGDVFIVNGGFAKANPKIVKGIVHGILEGNSRVRTAPEKYHATIATAFGWELDDVATELAKTHLANFPENEAFFNETIDSAGSFGYIYETAAFTYGSGLIKASDGDRFLSLAALTQIGNEGVYKDQKASITPIHSEGVSGAEETALLSKSIIFEFDPNESALDTKIPDNKKGLESIAKLLQVSPGSTILLRGHAEGSRVEKARKQGGDAAARKLVLKLKALSKERCNTLKRLLREEHGVDDARMRVEGVGADEPTGKGRDRDRRVETLWFPVS